MKYSPNCSLPHFFLLFHFYPSKLCLDQTWKCLKSCGGKTNPLVWWDFKPPPPHPPQLNVWTSFHKYLNFWELCQPNSNSQPTEAFPSLLIAWQRRVCLSVLLRFSVLHDVAHTWCYNTHMQQDELGKRRKHFALSWLAALQLYLHSYLSTEVACMCLFEREVYKWSRFYWSTVSLKIKIKNPQCFL